MKNIIDSDERRLAVTTFDKNVVVTAGAGTGKTALLVDRIIHLIVREPSPLKITDIVALTFTNKAANEMKIRLKERLQRIISYLCYSESSVHEDPLALDIIDKYKLSRDRIVERINDALNNLEKAQICTMHSFAGFILRLFPIEAGIDPKFREDDGSEFEEHFNHEWEEWLDVELSTESPHKESWKLILNKTGLESVKAFARELCSEAVPILNLMWITNRLGLSEDLHRWLESHQRKAHVLLCRYTKTRKIERLLAQAYEVFDGILLNKDIRAIIDDMPSGHPPAGWTEEDYREARLSINVARRLLAADNTFFYNLLKVLHPFATSFRKRFVASGNISFDGLLTFCWDLLKTRPKVREELKGRFKAILVDEFQDTDPIQYEIILYLSEITGRHEANWRNIQLEQGKLFIVGDPKQSIYAFRRADIEAYSHVVEMIISGQGGIRADLSTSFRSHNKIINVVNGLFRHIIRKKELLQPEYVDLMDYPDKRGDQIGSLPVQGVELRIIDGRVMSDIDASTAIRLEAEAIGRWLKEEMLDIETIYESKDKKAVLSPRHVAILLRKLTDVHEYIEALRRYDIPYIVEGERHFYATQEVIDFVNLLKTIDNPYDKVALVGVLRSPLGGLSDRDIYELNRLSLLDYGVTSLESGDIPCSSVISNLYGTLRRLNSEIGVMPLPVAIACIFDNLPILEFAASSYHGEQAVANLLKIQRIAESLSSRSDLTFKGFTVLLDKRVIGLEEEGESLLTEETVDAVRILSIHRAKGLEFPVVIVAGMHSSVRGGEDNISVMYDWSSNEIGFKVENLRNHAAVMLQEKKMIRDEEEQKRLLYVAMTRARECLVLSGTLYVRTNRDSFLSMIEDVIGESTGDRSISEITIGEGRIRQTVLDPADCVPQYTKKKIVISLPESSSISRKDWQEIHKSEEIEILSDLWTSRNNRYDSITKKALFVSPSMMEELIEKSTEKMDMRTKDRSEKDHAILIGTMAHHILEKWDFRDDTSHFHDAVEDVCLKFMPEEFTAEASSIKDELKKIFDSFSSSPAYGELKRVDIIGREVPFTLPWDDQIMDGVIDLIYQDCSRVFVADYKTDKVSEEDSEERVKEYALSGKIYSEAVQRCLNINVAGFKLIFLRPGKIVSVNLT